MTFLQRINNSREPIAYRLLQSWLLLPIFVLVAQFLELQLILGDLFLFYINSLNFFTTSFALICFVQTYQEKGCSHFRDYFKHTVGNKYLLLMLIWGFFTSVFSGNINVAFYGHSHIFEGYIIYLTYAAIFYCGLNITHDALQKKLLKLFAFVSVPLCLISIAQYYGLDTACVGVHVIRTRQGLPFLCSIYYNTNHFAYHLVMTALTSYGFFLYSPTKNSRLLYLCITAVNQFTLIINNTFGGYLAVLFPLVLVSGYYYRTNSPRFRLSLIPLSLYLLFSLTSGSIVTKNFTNLFWDFNRIAANNVDANKAGSERWKLWKYGLQIALAHPLFGVGPENALSYYRAFDIREGRCHNEFLQHAMFMGIPALLFYLKYLQEKYCLLKRTMTDLSNTQAIIILTVSGYLISSFFGVSINYIYPYFMVLLGLWHHCEE